MKKLMLLTMLLMQSFISVCQTSNSLQPVLIKEKGKVTWYAFNHEQVVDILKCYAERDIHKEKIDSLQAIVKTYDTQTVEYKDLVKTLEETNTKFYKLTEQYDSVNKNLEKIQVDYITIKDSLEYKIKKKNKVIFLLTTSNIIAVVIIALLVL